MTISSLYHTLYQKIGQIRPKERVTRLRNMAWMLVGICLGRSVHLSRIANYIPGKATQSSKTRRMMRLVDNGAIQVRAWYQSIAMNLLAAIVAQESKVRLLVDGTKIGHGHQLLIVSVAYRRRALPIAWTWVKGNRGHSSARVQCALLRYVQQLMPAQARVMVAGDSEFGAVEVIRLLKEWHWQYALRQKGSHLFQSADQESWLRLDTLVTAPGQVRWLDQCRLTAKHGQPSNLLALWQKREKEPWLIATNLSSPRETRHFYSRRMWLEEMFADFKKHGFDLEASCLHHFLRLSRLTLAVALLYFWLVTFGSQVIKNGFRRLVDRNDRRDLSIFRIGLDMVIRCLTNGDKFSIRASPYLY